MSFSAITIEQLRADWGLPQGGAYIDVDPLVPLIDKDSLQAIYLAIDPIDHPEVSNVFQMSIYDLASLIRGKRAYVCKDRIWRHGRYRSPGCTFLKFYVPETAICARESSLALDEHLITQDNLHGV